MVFRPPTHSIDSVAWAEGVLRTRKQDLKPFWPRKLHLGVEFDRTLWQNTPLDVLCIRCLINHIYAASCYHLSLCRFFYKTGAPELKERMSTTKKTSWFGEMAYGIFAEH